MGNDGWALVLVSIFTAIPACYAAYLSGRNGHALKTPGNKTIGEQMGELQTNQLVLRDELRVIAEAKVLADARLASAALSAIARLGAAGEDNPLLIEAASQAADRVEVEAERTARRKEREDRTKAIPSKS